MQIRHILQRVTISASRWIFKDRVNTYTCSPWTTRPWLRATRGPRSCRCPRFVDTWLLSRACPAVTLAARLLTSSPPFTLRRSCRQRGTASFDFYLFCTSVRRVVCALSWALTDLICISTLSLQKYEVAGLLFYVGQIAEFLQVCMPHASSSCRSRARLHLRRPQQMMFFIVNTRSAIPWTSTIAPLRYASEFTTLMGYYRIVESPGFYLALVLIGSEGSGGDGNACNAHTLSCVSSQSRGRCSFWAPPRGLLSNLHTRASRRRTSSAPCRLSLRSLRR